MANSKKQTKEYKGVEFTLSRNDCDFGGKWTVENNDWNIGIEYSRKKDAIEMAHFAIDNT